MVFFLTDGLSNTGMWSIFLIWVDGLGRRGFFEGFEVFEIVAEGM